MAKDIIFEMDPAYLARLDRAVKISLQETAEAIRTDILQEQTMPWRTGHLQDESTFVDTDSTGTTAYVNSDTPYARRLYFHPEYHFNQSENPAAGGEWFEPYISGRKKTFPQEAFAKLLRRNGGTS